MMMTGLRNASLRDVASLAGVSIATVSRVLTSANHPVSAATRARVISAAAALDYHPDAIARSLKRGRSGLVGVLVHDIGDEFAGEALRGIEGVASAHGYLMAVCASGGCPGREMAALRSLRRARADGIILADAGLSDPEHQSELSAHVVSLMGQGHGVVAMASQAIPLPRVRVDDAALGATGIQYLARRGHRHIAIVTGPRNTFATMDRLEGCRQALAAAAVSYDPELVVAADLAPGSAAGAVDELVNRGAYFTGMYVVGGGLADEVYRTLSRYGIRVPEEVSVLGVSHGSPRHDAAASLTTFAVPVRRMGQRAMETVLAHTQPGRRPTAPASEPDEVMDFELREGNSVRSLAGLARR
jgi:LacI family transcriptional regulator